MKKYVLFCFVRSVEVNRTVVTPVISLSIPGDQINATLDPPLYIYFEHDEVHMRKANMAICQGDHKKI